MPHLSNCKNDGTYETRFQADLDLITFIANASKKPIIARVILIKNARKDLNYSNNPIFLRSFLAMSKGVEGRFETFF